jgi:hypothetical protein
MEENTWLRWKARIGSLKVVAIFGILGAFFGLTWATKELNTAQANSSTPQAVTLAQIVNGEVGRPRYVAVEGYAVYDVGYTERNNGVKTAEYYYLVDETGGYAVLIKADHLDLDKRVNGPLALTGITEFPSTSPELYTAISDDVASFAAEGFRITPEIFIRENARPANATTALLLVAGFAALGLVSLVVMFFPGMVFVPAATQPGGVAQLGGVRQGVQVTGRLQQLKRIQPEIEIGKAWRKFTMVVANIIPLENRQVMIYVHYIYRHNGIKVNDTHWALTLNAMSVTSVEPGKVLGFKDRYAVRFTHTQRKEKPEELVLTFAKPEDQANFVAMLRAANFIISGLGIGVV